MSRSGYSDDCLYLNLWRANVDRSLFSKRGQAFLKDLIQALDVMPDKKLIKGSLECDGEVCALGALGVKRGIKMDDLDQEDPDEVGMVFNIAPILAQETVYQNDERAWGETPNQRWERMKLWAKAHLIVDEAT